MSIKSAKRGFTVVEVSIFLAITGLIFVGMIVGIRSSLTQNHYDDDVNALAYFLQNAYSKVISVENTYNHNGKSEKAIYGKLITFGESRNLNGTTNSANDVFIYDVVGDIADGDLGSSLLALKTLNANVTTVEDDEVVFSGIADSYHARWGTTIENTNATSTLLNASVLIVRSPSNGNIFTYVAPQTIEVNKDKMNGTQNSLLNAIKAGKFSIMGLDICVNMDRSVYGGKRKDIRITSASRGAAGVQVMHLNDAYNKCN